MFNCCNVLEKLEIANFNLDNHTGEKTNLFYSVPNSVQIITNKNMKAWLDTNYPNFTKVTIID